MPDSGQVRVFHAKNGHNQLVTLTEYIRACGDFGRDHGKEGESEPAAWGPRNVLFEVGLTDGCFERQRALAAR